MESLRPYQSEAKEAILSAWAGEHRKTLLVLPTGCHALGERVLTSDGTIKRVEDIYEGDSLMGSDGEERRVLKRHVGTSDLYTVTPVKGTPFTVTADHVLTLVNTEDRDSKYVDIKLSDWMKQPKSWRGTHKLIRSKGIERFQNRDESYPIDPYFLGVLIADGCIINNASITTAEPEVVKVIEEQAEKYSLIIRTEPAGKATTYFLSTGKKRPGNPLVKELRSLGLFGKKSGEKFIPDCYKYAEKSVRLEILAGLIDSDGSKRENLWDYVTKSERLAEDIAFICRSLGLYTSVRPCVKGYDDFREIYYRMAICGNCDIVPCRVERKKCTARRQKKSVLRTGFSVSYAGKGPYVGFTVDGDNRYLLSDFTITHNCGKTIVFSSVLSESLRNTDNKALVLAHREELLKQAQDKLEVFSGLGSALEKAESHAYGSQEPVVLGSVQTLSNVSRLNEYPEDYFSHIVVDEAHHTMSDSYLKVLRHFPEAKVLGVTATPSRSDKKNLAEFYENISYEYGLRDAIHDGWLCPIKAQMIPLKVDLRNVAITNGDYSASGLGSALDPYLEMIAEEMTKYAKGRRTVVFLPLVSTSQKFTRILQKHGFRAAEVNGESSNREEILKGFENGEYDVLCNSMLLTEGWDCPSVDCIVCLRPTKVHSLYCLDALTEILTEKGWKGINDTIEIGEKIAAFNPITSEIVYSPCLATIKRPLEEDEFFCNVKGQSTDIRVTNKHRMLYDNKRKKGWKFKTAEELADMRDGAYIPVSGRNTFPGVPLTDDEIRFIGWVMTDGTINWRNNAIAICQSSNQPHLEEIQKCIDGCNLKNTRAIRNSRSNFTRTADNVVWTISKGIPRGRDKDKRGWGYLSNYISKDISKKLFEMTERQFDVLLETIHLADGAKVLNQSWTSRSYHISKGNKTFIENLQIMALQRGYRANISQSDRGRKNTLYTLHLKKTPFSKVGSVSGLHAVWDKETYRKENCWCVQNEMGTLVTRRNGKVTMMGNCQILGRGTRLYPGKKELLVLDFLWLTTRHDICRPSKLLGLSEEKEEKLNRRIEEGEAVDLLEAEEEIERDAVKEREKNLRKELEKMRHKKLVLVDPLQYAVSISDEALLSYEPTFTWEFGPPSEKQLNALSNWGIAPESVGTCGYAHELLNRLSTRKELGLTTPKQIRILERYNFQHVGEWKKDEASSVISRLSNNGWRLPNGFNAETYRPRGVRL